MAFQTNKIFPEFENTFGPTTEDPKYPISYGPRSGFFMILDTKASMNPKKVMKKGLIKLAEPNNNFLISVGNSWNAFDLFAIKPGY